MADCYHVERLVHYVEWLLCCKICRALNDFVTIENDLYSVEWFLLCWKICTALSNFYWFALCCMIYTKICTTLNHYSVEWFVQSWMICIALKDLYRAEKFVKHWMILTTLNDL